MPRSNRFIAALTLMTALFVTPMLFGDDEHGHGHGHGHGKGHEKHQMAQQEQGWERRGDFEYREFGRDERPPGWGHGKKVGWGNCGMPPGQAKKYGCRSYVYQGRTHYYYEGDDGRVFVRRPIVAIHGSVDIVK